MQGTGSSTSAPPDSSTFSADDVEKSVDTNSSGRSWVWFPSMHELTTHYLKELGFLACLAQFIGATVFWVGSIPYVELAILAYDMQISGFTALPGVNNKISQGLLDGVYWIPQIVGGSGKKSSIGFA